MPEEYKEDEMKEFLMQNLEWILAVVGFVVFAVLVAGAVRKAKRIERDGLNRLKG